MFRPCNIVLSLGDSGRKRPLFPLGATLEQIERELRDYDTADLMTRRQRRRRIGIGQCMDEPSRIAVGMSVDERDPSGLHVKS